MRNATSSWLASARQLLGNEKTDRRSKAKSRRLMFENLERREVFSTDYLSALAIGNETDASIVNQVAADAAGNTYVRGSFGGTVDFDPAAVHTGDVDILTARNNTTDSFIAKYAPDNSLLWVRNSLGGKFKLDATGNMYVAGSFMGTTVIGGVTLVSAGAYDGFVAKLDGNGSTLWATRWGSVDNDSGVDIDFDANGNVFTGGTRTNASTNARLGVQAVKLNGNGATLWSKYVATNPGYGSFALAANSIGGAVLVGDFRGTVDFDPSSRTKYVSVGTSDSSMWASYVLNLDANGNYKWVNAFQGTEGSSGSTMSRAVDVSVDPSGSIVVAGRFAGSVDFKSGTGTAILSGNVASSYVTKLNSNGGFVWARAIAVGASDTSSDVASTYSLAVDALGSIYVAGSFTGTVDFDPTSGVANRTSSAGKSDMYVTCLTSNGTLSWLETIGGGELLPQSIDVGADGSIYIAGRFSGAVDFDPGPNEHILSTNGTLNKGFITRWRRS